MQIQDAKQLFLMDRRSKGLVERSLHEYDLSISYFIKDTGIITTDSINKPAVNAWILHLAETKKPITINKYIRDIRAFIYWCIDQEYITKAFKISTVKAQQEGDKYYTDAELQALSRKPDAKAGFVEWRTWAMICFALGTGARLSTITNVHIADINMQDGTVYYRHTKNKKFALVPLTPRLLLILNEFILKFGIDPNGPMFPDVTGEILSTNGAHRALEHYCNAREVERHNWHGFRHSFARTWVLQGGDIARLQVMLQHSSILQTQHYATLYGTDLHGLEQYTALDNLPTTKTRKYK